MGKCRTEGRGLHGTAVKKPSSIYSGERLLSEDLCCAKKLNKLIVSLGSSVCVTVVTGYSRCDATLGLGTTWPWLPGLLLAMRGSHRMEIRETHIAAVAL